MIEHICVVSQEEGELESGERERFHDPSRIAERGFQN